MFFSKFKYSNYHVLIHYFSFMFEVWIENHPFSIEGMNQLHEFLIKMFKFQNIANLPQSSTKFVAFLDFFLMGKGMITNSKRNGFSKVVFRTNMFRSEIQFFKSCFQELTPLIITTNFQNYSSEIRLHTIFINTEKIQKFELECIFYTHLLPIPISFIRVAKRESF